MLAGKSLRNVGGFLSSNAAHLSGRRALAGKAYETLDERPERPRWRLFRNQELGISLTPHLRVYAEQKRELSLPNHRKAQGAGRAWWLFLQTMALKKVYLLAGCSLLLGNLTLPNLSSPLGGRSTASLLQNGGIAGRLSDVPDVNT